MALSAFKSTTRRSCLIGSDGNAPSVSGSRSEARSQKGSHRRSRSSTDLSQKYVSDTEYGGRHRGKSSARYMSSDSESDMDGGNSWRRSQRKKNELSDARDFRSSTYQQCGLRKMPSYHDLSSVNPSRLSTSSVRNNDSRGDHPEGGEEEKTIKAVCAQLRSLKTDSLSGDLDAITDAMRAEVRRAVADIRMELEQSMKQSCSSTEAFEEGSIGDSIGGDVIQAVADIRKEYATKLEQSEKKVRELWAQLAVEERRCLEFAKIVKELLPAPTPSRHKVSRRRKGSAEKQLVSKWLDEEAHKYLEECVSISSLESDDFDSFYKDGHCQRLATRDIGSRKKSGAKHWNDLGDKNKIPQGEDSKRAKDDLVGKDGVVLPWLQWEADSSVYEKKSRQEGRAELDQCSAKKNYRNDPSVAGSNITSVTCSSIVGSDSRSFMNSVPASHVKKQTVVTKARGDAKGTIISSAEFTSENTFKPHHEAADNGGVLTAKAHQFSAGSTYSKHGKTNKNLSTICADDQLLERIRFRNRIEHGELVLCMGFPF